MKNRLTFADTISALLENKRKTYPQHQLVRDLFSLCLAGEAGDYSEASDDNITFSRWCNGARPIPAEILKTYQTEMGYARMTEDFHDKIIPNLVNVPHAREMMSELIDISRPIIGSEKAEELLGTSDHAKFFTKQFCMLYCAIMRKAVCIRRT
jgi:hypothetical protein